MRALEAQGLALHLIVTGTRHFNDRGFVSTVLERINRERGIGSLFYCNSTRATSFADRWAQAWLVRVFWVRPDRILRQVPVHGVIAFDGPDDFVERARDAGKVVWRLTSPEAAVQRPKPG